MNKKLAKLDKYEQELEDNIQYCKRISNDKVIVKKLELAAKKHLLAKQAVTIKVSLRDIEVIKIKASKLGVPYQTYLNILIHKDALSL